MSPKTFWIAASCVLVVIGLRPVFSSGASPANKERVIYSSTGTPDGEQPLSDLTIDSDGNIYGTTSQGGTGTGCNGYPCGTVFELRRTKDGWKEQVLHSFGGGSDGAVPAAGVILDKAGNLYGVTEGGGSGDSGTVFKLTPNSHGGWTESVLYSFTNGSDGAHPAANLVFDVQGNLYGTTSQGGSGNCGGYGCGTVFELIPQADGSWTETTIHQFTGAPDGAWPSSGVAIDPAGDIYGTTKSGGTGSCYLGGYFNGQTFGCGTIYKLTSSRGTWTETVSYNFIRGGGSGVYPSGEFLFLNADHLFGVAREGGDGGGTVLELRETKKGNWQQGDAHIFFGPPDGWNPTGKLTIDANGDLLGVTAAGGAAQQWGAVFEVRRSAQGWKESILHSFAGPPDGAYPSAGLASDLQGRLYGTTRYGGTGTGCDSDNHGCGAVYEVTP